MTDQLPRRPRRLFRRLITAVVLLAMCGIVAGVMTGKIPNFFDMTPKVQANQRTGSLISTVKVVKPRRDPNIALIVDQLATIEPYFRADLRARASGLVRKVNFDIGDKVKQGEVLLEVDVPESEQDVARSEAMILQREQELNVSKAKLKDAQAARQVSAATIKQRDADVQGTLATRDLKRRKFERFQQLAAKGSIVGSLVEEEERDYLTSEAAVTSAKANVEKARADYAESESKVEAAAADIELKQAQIVVARKDLDRARAVAEFAKLRAPFDGVVVRRNVDPGSFVQNATTGVSETLISLARLDIVTVTAKMPDSVAPSLTVGTPATVVVDDLPGVTIAATITRLAPSVQNADHTMRVEIDLFNGSNDEYKMLLASHQSGQRLTKSKKDPMPLRAFGESDTERRLLPGMTAMIRLSLGKFGGSPVLPSSVVYSRSGTSYIMVVEGGKTKQLPVRVQLNDGKSAIVAVLNKRRDADGVIRDVFTNLSGSEEVVMARQLELGDGAAVKSGLTDW
jgi:multidrug resistance efflux pump